MQSLVRHLAAVTFIVLAVAAAIHAQSSADEPKNEIEVRGFYAVPDGDLSFTTSGNIGSVVSFDRDFDFRNELGFEARYTHRTASGKHKFLAEYTDMRWDRSTRLSRSFTFLGQTYVANLNTEAELKLRTFRGMYSYRWGTEKFRIGPMADIGIVSTKVNLSGATNQGARSAEGTINKFAATIGYDLDYTPNSKVSFFNNAGGIVFFKDRLFHIEGGVKYFPVRNFGVSGGYKFRYYKLVDDPNFMKVSMHGPFFGAVLRF